MTKIFTPFKSALVAVAAFGLVHGCASSGPVQENTKPVPTTVGALHPELTNYDYPFSVKFYEFESQGQKLKMAYADSAANAEKVNGRTVVLLHGKNFSAAYWVRTLRDLNAAGFRVIAPDQIGFGKSSKPDYYQYSFQQLALNTNNLLKSLGITRATFVGHSMGGMLAARYSLMFPESVEKLALVNPIGLEDWRLLAPYRSIDETYLAELKATPESVKQYQSTAYFAGEWKPEYDSLIEVPVGWLKHADYRRIAWNSALTTDMVFTQPVVYEFPNIKAKTLLIIGQRDKTAIGKAWATPANAAKMGDYPRLGRLTAKAIKGSKLVEILGAGHLPQVEKYEAYIKALVDFIR